MDLTRVKRFPAGTADKEFINAVGGRMWTDQTGSPNPDPSWAYPGRPFSEGCGLDWIVVGGESGKGARPMHPGWARSLRDQCVDAGVPFFLKQWGAWAPLQKALPATPGSPGMAAWPDGRIGIDVPAATGFGIAMFHGSKSITGRLLDGVQHDGTPA